jgi:hypothetical protein
MRRLPPDPLAFLVARLRMAGSGLAARWGRSSLVAPGGPVVSLTSFGARIQNAHLAIASIGQGTLLPSRIVLWLDDLDQVVRPIPQLRRLQRRGLEIRHCDDLGPHKKYQPYVQSIEHHDVAMVTADDDIVYARRWLETLWADHLRDPDAIFAHRVNRITVTGGEIAPYRAWGRAEDDRRTPRNYAVGIKGVLYPPAFLDRLRTYGTEFMAEAPGSSDTWLFHVGLRERTDVLPVLALGGDAVTPFRGVAASPALMDQNVGRDRNDRVRAALLSDDEIAAVVNEHF